MDFDASILKRVRERLGASDTQVIPPFEESILFSARPDKALVQKTPQVKQKPQKTQPVLLPQLELDPADFRPKRAPLSEGLADTQVLQAATQTQKHSPRAHLPHSRLSRSPNASLSQLESDASGTEKNTQTQVLAAEISRATITDEDNDLNDVTTTVDSSVQRTVTSKAELDRIDRDLCEQKRTAQIQPVFVQRAMNPVDKLLDALQSDSDFDPRPDIDTTAPLSPHTSQPPHVVKNDLLDELDSDLELPEAVDAIAKGFSSPKKKKKSPIDEYALRLKSQLHTSSPGAQELIELDDSDDSSAPTLSKVQMLLVKQRYSKRAPCQAAKRTDLVNALRRANAQQLMQMKRENPDVVIIEDEEEEEMENLLDHEIERARRLQKQEKQQRRAAAALLRLTTPADADVSVENVPGSDGDVPESEVDEEDDDYEEEDDDEDAGETCDTLVVKRGRRFVLSDDKDDGATPKTLSDERHDDSYMFGGARLDAEEDSRDVVTHVLSDRARSETPANAVIDDDFKRSTTPRLFENLPPRRDTSLSVDDTLITVAVEPELHSFHELESGFWDDADVATQATQKDATEKDATQPDLILSLDEEDADFAAAVRNGRQSVRENFRALSDSPESDASEQVLLQQKVAEYEAKMRRRELKARRRRKEMERRAKGVVEGEAEDSEDEWKGIGGADHEVSEQENSEDERMIDNNFNLVINDDEVRRKFMQQYQIKDRQELERLVDDIKNHRLAKRARAARLDVELSDDENELLKAYRRKKLEEQKQRLLDSQNTLASLKSERSRAFFELITEDDAPRVFLSSDSDGAGHESILPRNPALPRDTMQDTAHNSQATTRSSQTDADEPLPKKVIRLDEAFVQRQLSFLCSTEENKYAQVQQHADFQHGVDEPVEDLATLKSRCMRNLYSFSAGRQPEQKRAAHVLTVDNDDDFGPVFKKPSVVGSFKLCHEKRVGQVSTGLFSGVTVNKQYKVASGAKASITYISEASSAKPVLVVKSLHTQAIEKKVDQTKHDSALFSSGSTFT